MRVIYGTFIYITGEDKDKLLSCGLNAEAVDNYKVCFTSALTWYLVMLLGFVCLWIGCACCQRENRA